MLAEDGYLRSVGRHDAALSMVFDHVGIYYDASSPSYLEKLITETLDAVEITHTKSIINTWRVSRVSKYNDANEFSGKLPEDYVLVCDQTRGDASILYGQANEKSFQRMLKAALVENPDSKIVIKTHPDTLTRAKQGHLDQFTLEKNNRILLIRRKCHPVRLIEYAKAIYTVTSQMGFEALMWGKRVRTFGMPFYAGWGLTEDNLPAPERRGRATLEQLVHSALIRYPRYIDPLTGKRCGVERIVEHISLQQQMRLQLPSEITAIGFSRWKRPIITKFCRDPMFISHLTGKKRI